MSLAGSRLSLLRILFREKHLQNQLKSQEVLSERRNQQVSEVETYTEPALAWRCWIVRNDWFPRLHSVTGSGCEKRDRRVPWWPRTPLKADCVHLGHDAPFDVCHCGIYGTTSFWNAVSWLEWNQNETDGWKTNLVIIGTVKLWGNVIEYSAGYRAEYGYPEELWVFPMPWGKQDYKLTLAEIADYLGDSFGVPCHLVDSYRDIPDKDRIFARQHTPIPVIPAGEEA